MAGDIDEGSFALGQLTGKIDNMEQTQQAMFKKLDSIEKSLNHVKIKNAGQAATIATIFSLIVVFFKDLFHRG